jgi:hypothetical protein
MRTQVGVALSFAKGEVEIHERVAQLPEKYLAGHWCLR